jgi:tRNA-splicing endonuclease subunit Sen54
MPEPILTNTAMASSVSSTSAASAGPSVSRSESRHNPRTPATTPVPAVTAGSDDEDDEDGERPNVEALRSFARQVQMASPSQHITRVKVVIPKRGEKDFEPLDETVNIQAKMLRESREALFDALGGVRGSGR